MLFIYNSPQLQFVKHKSISLEPRLTLVPQLIGVLLSFFRFFIYCLALFLQSKTQGGSLLVFKAFQLALIGLIVSIIQSFCWMQVAQLNKWPLIEWLDIDLFLTRGTWNSNLNAFFCLLLVLTLVFYRFFFWFLCQQLVSFRFKFSHEYLFPLLFQCLLLFHFSFSKHWTFFDQFWR